MNQAACAWIGSKACWMWWVRTLPLLGKELIPVAGAGLRLLLSRDGSDLRKRLLMTLIRDDRLHTDDVRALVGLLGRTFGPGRLAGGILQRLNPLAAA